MRSLLTLHIGTPKSGTTYLQAILSAGRPDLVRRGILYPGERYLPRAGFNQQPAVYAAGRRHIGWVGPEARENAVRYYHRLCEETSAHDGRVLISAESLAFFDADEIRGLLDGLHANPGRVEVVITARDLGRVLPSIWQQNIKNGATEPMDSYLESVAALRDTDVPLWTAFGLPGLVRRWQDAVGAERVSLVTAPHGGGDMLWHRFAEATDLPTSIGASAPTATAELRLVDRNLSLTQGQAEVLRRVNLVLRARAGDEHEVQTLRRRVLLAWMSAGDGQGSRIALPPSLRPTVDRWAAEDVEALQRIGVRVLGDLNDLLPRRGASPAAQEAGPVTDLLDEAAGALVLLAASRPSSTSSTVFPNRCRAAVRRRLRRFRTVFSRRGSTRRSTPPTVSPTPAVVDLSDAVELRGSAERAAHIVARGRPL